MISTPALETLTDQALLHQLGELVRKDCYHTAHLLRHIDAIDRRQLWAKQGHPSMFEFLVSRHHMSESTAGKRIGAARTARRFPVLFDMVARGEIHLSGIHRLKAHLTADNYEQVLAQAKYKTIREIEQLVARLAPRPDAPFTLRALPNRTPAPPALAPPPLGTSTPIAPAPALEPEPEPAPAPVTVSVTTPKPQRSPDPVPLAPGRYKLQVTLCEDAHEKLKQLQDLLAHQLPNGDPAAIIERALEALLTQVHQRKTGVTSKPHVPKPRAPKPRAPKPRAAKPRAAKPRAPKPRAPKPRAQRPPSSAKGRTRTVPASLRREVWTRDQGRCAFVGDDGHRCNATRGLEFAHIHPWAKGGEHTAPNVSLRCIAHNALEAEQDFGASQMASKRKRRLL